MPPTTAALDSSHTVAVLDQAGREICLSLGRYVIGRAPASDIVVNSPLASRQHARLLVTTSSVTVEDLNSANGVAINGRRIRGAYALTPGDRIGLGGQEIEFRSVGMAPEVDRTLVGDYPERPNPRAGVGVESGTYPSSPDRTEPHDDFALVGSMADRALASHRYSDAVDILRYRLTSVLDEAKRGHLLPVRSREAALSFACKLATATRDGKWIDYALELLVCQFVPCPDNLSDSLELALNNVAVFDRTLLDRYVRSLRLLPPSIERIRGSQRAETLLRIAQSKR